MSGQKLKQKSTLAVKARLWAEYLQIASFNASRLLFVSYEDGVKVATLALKCIAYADHGLDKFWSMNIIFELLAQIRNMTIKGSVVYFSVVF